MNKSAVFIYEYKYSYFRNGMVLIKKSNSFVHAPVKQHARSNR